VRAAPRIVALGGHDLSTRPHELAVLEHMLALTYVDRPRVCMLPTASGDPHDAIHRFYTALDRFDARPSHISLFRLERERVDLRRQLMEQDLIYVDGGSLLNLVAIWRAHSLPSLMREAWRAGVLLAGQSAGAMCWFAASITASGGAPQAAKGLGFLPGSLCVHYRRDPARRTAYLEAVSSGLPGGYAIDDGAGLLFEGLRAVEAFAGRPGARVVRVDRDEDGIQEAEVIPIPLRPPALDPDPALEEMRRHRLALRNR